MNTITQATLYDHLVDATVSLLKIARQMSWNAISGNCLYITSEIENSPSGFSDQYKLRKQKNDQKIPVALVDLMPELLSLYDNLYDINLYVYRAKRGITIVEIAYYPKSSLDVECRKTVIGSPPMLHCKVPIPNYRGLEEDRNKKFDINWQLDPLNHRFMMFWTRLKYKLGLYPF